MCDKVIALAVRRGELYEYRGPDQTDYPIRMDGVTTDAVFRVDNRAHRLTSRLNGVKYYARKQDSDDGQILLDLVDDLRGKRDKEPILAVIDEYIAMLDGEPA